MIKSFNILFDENKSNFKAEKFYSFFCIFLIILT